MRVFSESILRELISPSMQAAVQGQCETSAEKGDLCAAFFLRRGANVRVTVSKLSQPKYGIFYLHESVVLNVLQKGANISGV